jgi:hypothetical protein
MEDVSSGDAMGVLLLGTLVLLEVPEKLCAQNAISTRQSGGKRGELKIAAKMKSKRADSKDLRKRMNLKTCLSERDCTRRIAMQCKEE